MCPLLTSRAGLALYDIYYDNMLYDVVFIIYFLIDQSAGPYENFISKAQKLDLFIILRTEVYLTFEIFYFVFMNYIQIEINYLVYS